jgi:hypothetical protein
MRPASVVIAAFIVITAALSGGRVACSSCRLALCSPFPGWQFIALYRRLANSGTLEDFQRLRDIRARGSRGEVVRSAESFSATAALISWLSATPSASASLRAASRSEG